MRSSFVVSGVVAALIVVFPGLAIGGLITNGGFETGDFTGWTVTGPAGVYGVAHSSAHSGSWGTWFGAVTGLNYISQTLATVPGQAYQISFFIANNPGPAGTPPQNRGEIWWGNTLVDSGTNAPLLTWQLNTYVVTATGASTVLKFGFNNPPGYWKLDDVSVDAVPEPATAMFCGAGLCLLAAFRRFRPRP